MSEENVELIEAQLNAQVHEGIDPWLKYFADDINYRAIKDAPGREDALEAAGLSE